MDPQDALPDPTQDPEEPLHRLVAEGRLDEARAWIRQREGQPLSEAMEHRTLAEAAELVGHVALAITEYNLCLREDREQPLVLLRLARLRADMGDLDRACRAYRRYLEAVPDDQSVRHEVAEFVSDSGRPDLAVGFLERPRQNESPESLVHETTGKDPEQKRRPLSLDDPSPSDPKEHPADSPFLPTDSHCVTFAALFAGREGVHARQWASATGRTGYSPVREPFTPQVARRHLMGIYTVGIYPVRMDNTVLFAALDLDVNSGVKPSSDEGRAFADRLHRAHHAALLAMDCAASMGLPTLLEDSGHKGRHVWLLFAQPVPAAAARRLGLLIAQAIPSAGPDVTVEVFPKQSRVGQGGLGNLIKLPLGVHRLTGRRGHLLDPATGLPQVRPFDVLESYRRIERTTISRILEHHHDEVFSTSQLHIIRDDPEPETVGPTPPPRTMEASSVPPLDPTSSPLPEQEPYDPLRDAEVLAILERCPVLAEVTRRVDQGGVLSTDERLVLTHTLGHLTRGPDAVNAWLSRALNLDASLLLKSRLRGQPISCPRIRARLPLITASVECACSFDPVSGIYPTPLLHLGTTRASQRLGNDPLVVTRLEVDRMVADLVQARLQATRAMQLAREIESRLRVLLEDQRIDQIQTSRGTVRLGPSGLVLDLSESLPPSSERGPCPSST